MKKFFKSFALIAAAAMALAACQKEVEAPVQEEGLYEYRFAIDEGTKAVIGDSNIEWVAGDQVGMFIAANGDYTGYKGYAKIDVSTSPKTVILYSNSAIPAGTMAYAYAPYDADNKNNTADAAKINIKSIQTGAQVSAMPLAGLPFTVEEEIDAQAEAGNGTIKFMNLGSLINFKIFSTDEAYQSETVTSVKFEANKTIAGSAYIDLTAIDVEDEGSLELTFMDEADEANSVRVDQEMAVAAYKEEATPIKMVILPGLFEGTVTVTTDVATYTKEIPSREFNRSGSRTFGLDLAKAERTEGVEEVVKTLPYEEAFTTNQGEFTIDNVIIPDELGAIWSFDSQYGAKATAFVNPTNYESESWLISPWMDLTEVVNAEVSFSHAGNYFSNAAAIQNECTFWALSDDEGADWQQLTINKYFSGWTFVDAEVSLAEFVGKKVKVAFKYTSTSTKAGTWEIKNFKAYALKAYPELAFGDGSIVIDATINDEGIEEPELTNPHNLTVTYSSSNEDVATVDGTTGEVVIEGVAGTAVITAAFAGDDNYEAGEASYTIKVTDPNAGNAVYSLFSGDITEGDYVIVYDGGAMKASISSSRFEYEEPDILNDAITNPDAAIVWHIAASGDYWTIYNASVEQYAASTGAKNKAQLLSSGTDDKALWTVTGDETYEFVNKQNTTNSVNANLRRNGTYGFACYATTTGGALSLYKLN